jgi:hypothetical protein
MTDQEILERAERAARSVVVPDGRFEDLLRRRDRKRRNQRITAGVVGIAVFVAAVWIVTSGGAFDRTETPAATGPAETGPTENGPTETGATDFGQPWPPSPETGPPFGLDGVPTYAWDVTRQDIAVGESFMDAWLEGDGEAAAAMFNPEGTFDGLQPGVLPALHDWFRAGGWTLRGGGCGLYGGWGKGLGYVGCGFMYENDLTRALGTGPMDGTLYFVIDAGNIEAATTRVLESYSNGDFFVTDLVDNMFRSPNPERQDLFGPVWDMFIEWISSSHPEDFGRMYDADRGYPILDAQSIELWERYTDEFVASPQAVAESFTEWMANQSLDDQATRICMIATDRFWGAAKAGDLQRNDAAFYSTLARISEETLAELRALPLETEADRAAMDAFVPRAERMIELHRQQAEAAAAGDHKRLNELGEEWFHLRWRMSWSCLVSGFPG